MSMQDPIADMFTRIVMRKQPTKLKSSMPSSNMKVAIAKVLKDEGYIMNFRIDENEGKPKLLITLKYYNNKPVIEMIKRVSRPGLRKYADKENMPIVMDNLGITIVTTSRGVMTGRQAVAEGQGGEILCFVA